MKLIIAGGRDFRLKVAHGLMLDRIHEGAYGPVGEVVSGGCSGVDLDGESWARDKGIPVRRFCAHWTIHGKAAGPMRNREMAEYADALALFAGGRGTDSMYLEGCRNKLSIYDFRRVIAQFDGGYGRVGKIALAEGVCSICGNSSTILYIDPSEEEYNSGNICKKCIVEAFK